MRTFVRQTNACTSMGHVAHFSQKTKVLLRRMCLWLLSHEKVKEWKDTQLMVGVGKQAWSQPGLCLVIGGGGYNLTIKLNLPPPPGFWLTHPPTHPDQKIFPQEKNENYQRGPGLEVNFRDTNFLLASDPPTHPPPGCSINQPLCKGLVAAPGGSDQALCGAPGNSAPPGPRVEAHDGHCITASPCACAPRRRT